MNVILEIQEIVAGPIRDLYLEISSGPLFPVFAPPSFGDIAVNFGSSFGDANIGSTDFGSSDFGSSFGSSNGDQNFGSSGLEIPGSSLPGIPGLPDLT